MTNQVFSQLSEAQLHASQQCSQRIKQRVRDKGNIGFDEFMQIALFDSDYGYYQRKDEIFGAGGDFTTVPETSDHLAFCLAHAAAKIINNDSNTAILEIGAGSGKLCCEVLQTLSNLDMLPERYYIYETSAKLRDRQRALITKELPEFVEHVHWLDDLSCEIETAIIIANEVLDALPVKCFQMKEQGIKEKVVALNDAGEFNWSLKIPNDALTEALDSIVTVFDESFTEAYESEINPNLESTLASWASICKKCVMLLIDYGYPRHEYYHPQRNMGTLRSYYKHQVSEDVLAFPGLQDITADVDFTAIAEVADKLNMKVLSFGSQRNFMLANQLLDWQPNTDDEVERLAQIAQLKQLTLMYFDAKQFTLRDMRARL